LPFLFIVVDSIAKVGRKVLQGHVLLCKDFKERRQEGIYLGPHGKIVVKQTPSTSLKEECSFHLDRLVTIKTND